jgi:hypothetical protein
MQKPVECLDCQWFAPLTVTEGVTRDVCETPNGTPRVIIPKLTGTQSYDDPHIRNVNQDCADFTPYGSQHPYWWDAHLSPRNVRWLDTSFAWPHKLVLGFLFLLSALILCSCTAIDAANTVPFMPRPTTTKEMAVADAPRVAYDRSLKAIIGMGGTITHMQPDAYWISSVINQAVAFNVVITPTGSGSLLSASQHVSTGYIALAPVRVCDEFFVAYRR